MTTQKIKICKVEKDMLTDEKIEEILKEDEYYSMLSDEEFEEQKDDYEHFLNELTEEEADFLNEYNERYIIAVKTILNIVSIGDDQELEM